jgi:dihydrofolate synthase/folylpolyglutamate synthase
MVGIHQIRNAICALTVINALQRECIIKVKKEKIYEGFFKAKQTGRFEILRRKPYMIIDGAHNEAGAASLAETVKDLFDGCRILLVIGMLTDKKTDILLDKFSEITQVFIATEPNNPRKLPSVKLFNAIKKAGMKGIAIEKLEEACRYVEGLTDYDVIVFAGSLYLIGEVRGILNHEKE